MLALFALTLSLSAALLFLVQPMFAKMLMPRLGGTPAVWNTCVVFFQVTLLAGYFYAHATPRLSPRRLAWTHATVLLLPLLVLPVEIRDFWPVPPGRHPSAWLSLALIASVGLPFFALATSAPILQRWFSATTHWSARDPYFLYAAGNAGSLLALVAYPLLVEPTLSLSTQRRLWAFGYGVFVLLTVVCAWLARRSMRSSIDEAAARGAIRAAAISWSTRLRWLALAAIPSSLMLSTNTLITTDIAGVPLLWVVPLAIYLLTFVLVFARRQILPHRLLSAILPLAIIPSVLAVVRDTMPSPSIIPVHLLTLFIAAMVCHGELARTRPGSAYLTDFYLLVAAGGALGGLFNTLIAPVLFTGATEYPLGLVLACLVRPTRPVADTAGETATEPPSRKGRVIDWLFDVSVAALVGLLVWLLGTVAERRGVSTDSFRGFVQIFALPLAAWLVFARRPRRSAFGLAAIFICAAWIPSGTEKVIHAERTFFGIHQVIDEGQQMKLLNGTTNHGSQFKAEELRCRPTSYYHPSGPIGQLFESFVGDHAKARVGIVGLGTAALAAYAREGQTWVFYEVNPAMEQIAREPRYFSYLTHCIDDYRIVIGDARLSMAASPDASHDVIVLDAFSSDAIPVHLLTREAIAMYFRKLGPGGVIAVHISNRYLDLEPVMASLVHATGVVGVIEPDDTVSSQQELEGKLSSTWVVLARSREDLGRIGQDSQWVPLTSRPDVRPWTDDFSDLVSVIDWTS